MAQKWEAKPGLVDPKSWYEGFAEGEKKSADRIEALEAENERLRDALADERNRSMMRAHPMPSVCTCYASAVDHVRYIEPVDPKSRRRCSCGCKRRASHRGMAQGIMLTGGCKLSMLRWVLDPFSHYRARAALKQD